MTTEGIKTTGFANNKVKGFLEEIDKIDDWAASEHGKISKKTLDRVNDVRDAADAIGIKKRVLNSVISEHRLRRKADNQRDKFANAVGGSDNGDALIDQLDNVRNSAGLPLFDAADEAEKKPAAAKAAPAKATPKKTPAKKAVPKKGTAGTSPAKAAAKMAAGEAAKPPLKPQFDDGGPMSGDRAKAVADMMDKAGATPPPGTKPS